jgi:prephenate dehydrogenase
MKITIIGGAGKMGQWLSRALADMSLHTILADKDTEKLKTIPQSPFIEIIPDSKEAVRQAKLIVVSVPLDKFEQAVQEIAPCIKPDSIVMDMSSVKARPVAIMHKYIKNSIVVGAHPLFGPNVKNVDGQNVVFTPTNDKEKSIAREIAKYYEDRGAKVTFMEPEAHDKMMAVVQGLSHFVAIAAADALSGLGNLKEMKDVSTTTFKIFLNYVESVIGDDPELYAAIQMEHPEMPGIYKKLTSSVDKFAGWVEQKDTRNFVKRMRELKLYLGK